VIDCFLAYVAGLLLLPTVFFGSFFTRGGALLFANLARCFLETSRVFFPFFALGIPPLFLVHHSPPDLLIHHEIVRSLTISRRS
jgi:hypothetical protein